METEKQELQKELNDLAKKISELNILLSNSVKSKPPTNNSIGLEMLKLALEAQNVWEKLDELAPGEYSLPRIVKDNLPINRD